MRKLLLITLLVILSILSFVIVLNKIEIGSISILGIKGIKEENDELNNKILLANNAYDNNYVQSIEKLEKASEELKKQKEEYDNYILDATNGNTTNQIQAYEIEFLWTKIGNYATDKNVILKMEVATNNETVKTYDLNFTATGKYVDITEFIYKLENDTKLLFKIDNFELVPNAGDGSTVKATFICKDVSINIQSAAKENVVEKGTNTTTNKNSSEIENETSTTTNDNLNKTEKTKE